MANTVFIFVEGVNSDATPNTSIKIYGTYSRNSYGYQIPWEVWVSWNASASILRETIFDKIIEVSSTIDPEGTLHSNDRKVWWGEPKIYT